MSNQVVLSVVVPLLNEESNIAALHEALTSALSKLAVPYEIIIVDDGRCDNTWAMNQASADKESHIKGDSISRNIGHQNAMYAGIKYSSGKAIITMDGDLQHPPEVITELFRAWEQGYKIVNTQRIDSHDTSLFKRLTSRLFYRFFSIFSGLPVAKGTSDFRLIDKQIANIVRTMRDSDLFLRGFIRWMGFPTTCIPFQAKERYSGTSKYNLSKMLRFSIAALLSFSSIPLKFGIWIGFITSLLAFAELTYIFFIYFQEGSVPGWASILTVVSFMFGILFILIGIIGTYLGSIFETVKNRPRFIVNETTGLIHNDLSEGEPSAS